jgi:Mg2+ and Co2+ transporter CorA
MQGCSSKLDLSWESFRTVVTLYQDPEPNSDSPAAVSGSNGANRVPLLDVNRLTVEAARPAPSVSQATQKERATTRERERRERERGRLVIRSPSPPPSTSATEVTDRLNATVDEGYSLSCGMRPTEDDFSPFHTPSWTPTGGRPGKDFEVSRKLWYLTLRRKGRFSQRRAQDYAMALAQSGVPSPSGDAAVYLTLDLLRDLGITSYGDGLRVLESIKALPLRGFDHLHPGSSAGGGLKKADCRSVFEAETSAKKRNGVGESQSPAAGSISPPPAQQNAPRSSQRSQGHLLFHLDYQLSHVHYLVPDVVRQFSYFSPDHGLLWIDLVGKDKLPEESADTVQSGSAKPGIPTGATLKKLSSGSFGTAAKKRRQRAPATPTSPSTSAAMKNFYTPPRERFLRLPSCQGIPVVSGESTTLKKSTAGGLTTWAARLDQFVLYNPMTGDRREVDLDPDPAVLLSPLLNEVEPLPRLIRDPFFPGRLAFTLRVATLEAEPQADTMRTLTNRWTFYVDLMDNYLLSVHRVDSFALANLRARCEENHWREDLSSYEVREFLLHLLENFALEYQKAFLITGSYLDVAESHVLKLSQGRHRTQRKAFRQEGTKTAPNGSQRPIMRNGRFAQGLRNLSVPPDVMQSLEGHRLPQLDIKLKNYRHLAEFLFRLHRRAVIYEKVIAFNRQVIFDELLGELSCSNIIIQSEMKPLFDTLQEEVQDLRHRAERLVSLHLSLTQFRMDRLMSLLTITTMFLLPMAFAATVWGMRFYLPETTLDAGYGLAWIIMFLWTALLTAVLLLVGKWKKLQTLENLLK